MSTTARKTPTRKPTPKVTETHKVEKKTEPVAPVQKKVFDQADGIKCRSITQGSLYMEGEKTKMLYSWTNYGDETQVEYRDLVSAVRVKSPFVFGPMFLIEDEDFINEFQVVKKFYDDNFTITELDRILSMPVNEMIDTIKGLPKGAFESMKTIAATAVSDGRLDSVKKINALDELFGTDMALLAQGE